MSIAKLLKSLHKSAQVAAAASVSLGKNAFPYEFFNEINELTDHETSLTLGKSKYLLTRKRNIWDNETTYTLKINDDVEILGSNSKRLGQALTIALKQVIGASAEQGLVGRRADCLFSAHPVLKQVLENYTIRDVLTDQYAGTMIKIQ